MRTRLTHFLILAALGAGLGHWLWRLLGPTPTPSDYVVGGNVTTLRAPESHAKVLYLRRPLYLPQRPLSAWIEVVARDRLEVFVNGKSVGLRENAGYAVAVIADLAPHLETGDNVLAISAQQYTSEYPPEVAVRGACHFEEEDPELTFGTDGRWRCQTVYERRGDYWFTRNFDDARWPLAERGQATLRAIVNSPPRAVTTPQRSRWIAPDAPTVAEVDMRGQIEVPESPRYAWLRLWSTTPYRLAVNGVVIDAKEEQLALTQPPPTIQWIYDVSALVRAGTNRVAAALSTEYPPPHLLLEMEVEGRSGRTYALATDESWQWRALPADDWLQPTPGAGAWRSCHVEQADVSRAPWHAPRRDVEFVYPWTLRARWLVNEVLLMVVAALAVWQVTALVTRRFLAADPTRPQREISLATLALVPTAVLLLGAIVATYDPRVPDESVYRPLWLVLALLLIAAQWYFLRASSRRPAGWTPLRNLHWRWGQRPDLVTSLVVAVVLCGAGLRLWGLTAQPVTPDECTGYRATMGFLERGYPSAVIAPDTPLGIVATSELVYVGTAASGLIFDDPRLVMRTPAVCWGILTILLLYIVGKNMFNRWVGVTAAALYAFSPYCVETSQIGRYFSQLQGFTLLTVYVFYRTLETPGPLPRRGLWLTALLFCCTYLSWEAVGLLAPGMMLAALVARRHDVRALFFNWSVWAGMAAVGIVILVQWVHRTLQQTLRLLYGSGATDVTLMPMWTYPGFDLWYYVQTASWSGDSFLPIAMLAVAAFLLLQPRFRRPAQTLFIIALSLAFAQALLLPVTTTRYAYHVLPLLLLLSAAGIVALAQALVRKVSTLNPPVLLGYARGVAVFFVVAVLAIATGLFVKPREMTAWQTGVNDDLDVLTTPDQVAATRYVRERLEPGDAVMVALPNQVHVYLGSAVDYWLQTQMALQLTLDDLHTLPLHRLSGEPTVPSLAQLRGALARHPRVWYITSPGSPVVSTSSVASTELVREQMEVVYEDFRTLVFLFGRNHLPADLQLQSETSLNEAPTVFLP
jgi:4-amino-4-deoxy-L-arabinose transferase-like glycosyltransferase